VIKDKRFLTGLGTGLIAGAILLQVMNFASAQSNQLVSPDKLYSQEEADELIRAAVVEANDPVTKVAEEEQQAAEQSPAQVQIVDEIPLSNSEEPEGQENNETVSAYSLTVYYKMTSEEVAEAAKEALLIEDTELMLKELIDRKLTGRIQVGQYTFTEKPEISELIGIITTPRK
jgi:predicted TIM-barrel fold metal-dependent hydrolase